ncbi:hypothetical protein [uncultured Variovorax sp.]|uniref:hypothetical protein n=1 Tax=uncultured Variovorax sp. TaxID=114708 RepID=UPI0026015890|nr:hypothetical protein [uncultured Variovorax sp.]
MRARDAIFGSLDSIALAHNTVHSTIIASGMQQVPAASFAGQAGNFVAGSPGAGETAVTSATVSGFYTDGYKLYKHPTLELYLQVFFRQCQVGTSMRYAFWYYRVGVELLGGALTPNKLSEAILSSSHQTSYQWGANFVPTTETPISASCGADHFWIHHSKSYLTNLTAGQASFPDGVSLLSLGIFRSDVASNTFLVATSPATVASSTPYGMQLSDSAVLGTRYWTCAGGVWASQLPTCAGFVFDPQASTTSAGVRVVRASKILDGARHRFNLGFMVRNGGVDDTLVNLDLDGGGPRDFRTCFGLGPCSPSYYQMPADSYSVPLLPWG